MENNPTSLWKHTRTRRILLAVGGTFIALSIYFSIFTYRTLIKNHQETTLMRLLGIVNSSSLLIDGDMHTALMSMYPNKDDIRLDSPDMYYDQIHRLLKTNEKANMLKTPIYTIVFDSTLNVYEFGVSSADTPYFRHMYKHVPEVLIKKYSDGGMIPPYMDEFGHWLSAFAPIKNKTGKTVAVLQADEKYDTYIEYVQQSIFKSIGMSLFLLVLLFGILFRILNHVLSRELKDKQALQLANEQNKKMSTDLALSVEEIKKTDDFRKEMIANFSHDLRTPLSSITGYIELLLNDTENKINTSDKEAYTRIAYTESLRLKRLVNELFELSKLESGQVSLKKEAFSLPELAHDVLHKYEIPCKEKNISLHTEIDESIHAVQADISWIDRLLQNLLDNAVKYCNPNGFIKLTIFEEGQKQHVKVCNSGTPIPQEDLPFVFDRYFRSSNHSGQGTSGLGLAIAKKIVDVHQGHIRAEVNEEVTTFRFELPTR